MTRYHGGKHKNGKKIAQVLNAEIDKHLTGENRYLGYCEPFHGMLGVYRHINYKPALIYLAGDTNKSVMLMWEKAQTGWIPSCDVLTKEEFKNLKYNGESTAEKGFIGCTQSFGGLYFHNHCVREQQKKALPGTAKRVSDIALNSVVSKVKFSYGDYTQFSDLKNFLIYCDPPYENSSGYRNDQSRGNNRYDYFDNLAFWTWTKKMAEHNTVFVSEYSTPKNVDYEIAYAFHQLDNNHNIRNEKVFKILN